MSPEKDSPMEEYRRKISVQHAKDDLDRDIKQKIQDTIDEAKEDEENEQMIIESKLSQLYPNILPIEVSS